MSNSAYNDYLRSKGSLRDPSGNDIWLQGSRDAEAGRPSAYFTISLLWGEAAALPYGRGYASGSRSREEHQSGFRDDAKDMD